MAVSVLFRIDQNGHIEVLTVGPTPDVTFDVDGCSQTRLSHPCVWLNLVVRAASRSHGVSLVRGLCPSLDRPVDAFAACRSPVATNTSYTAAEKSVLFDPGPGPVGTQTRTVGAALFSQWSRSVGSALSSSSVPRTTWSRILVNTRATWSSATRSAVIWSWW